MNVTMNALLAIALIVAFAPAASAQPRGGSAWERATTRSVADRHHNVPRSTDKARSGGSDWEPCDYYTCSSCG